jgi:hypothetical protein
VPGHGDGRPAGWVGDIVTDCKAGSAGEDPVERSPQRGLRKGAPEQGVVLLIDMVVVAQSWLLDSALRQRLARFLGLLLGAAPLTLRHRAGRVPNGAGLARACHPTDLGSDRSGATDPPRFEIERGQESDDRGRHGGE